MKKFLALLLALLMALSLVACGQEEVAPVDDGAAEPVDNTVYTIKYAHTCADTHAYQMLGVKFKELVEAQSDGRIVVELYPSSQLGGETDIMEGLQAGTIEMATISHGVAANFIDGLDCFALPFLFSGVEHYQKVMFGEIGQKFIETVDGQSGLKVASLWGSTFRVPFCKKGSLADISAFKGIKIRLMDVPLHMDIYAAMGANPTTMAMSEVYMGLQNGTVDAAENAVSSIYSQKFYEVAPHITNAPIIANGCITMFSQKFWDSLPAELQELCESAMTEAAKYADDFYVNAEGEARTAMEAEGATFYEVEDLTPFKEATADVRAEATKSMPDWVVNEILPAIDALA